jgi:hypothetical protein
MLLALSTVTTFTVVANVHAAPRTTSSPAATFVAVEDPKDETPRERLERKVHKLLDMNGISAVQKRTIDKMIEQFKKMNVPSEFMETFRERIDFDHVIALSVKAYADNLDEDTVDALITFFGTPAGQKYSAAFPDINDQAMQAGMEYGQSVAQEVLDEMKSKTK